VKLLSERNQVLEVANKWREQYSRHPEGRHTETQRKLDALDLTTASAEDVARIIGNDSWAKPRECDECGTPSWQVVQLGEEPDYESSTAIICPDCLRKALLLVEPQND